MRTKEEIMKNRWERKEDIDQIINFVKEFATKDNHDWSWVKNWNCKYFSIRFDMRDGAFIIKDGNGNRITFEELKYQKDFDETI